MLADRYFSNPGPSFPNHLLFVAGQTASVVTNLDSTLAWGCNSPLGTRTLINMDGIFSSVYSFFDVVSMARLLDEASLSWKFYGLPEGSWWHISVSNVRFILFARLSITCNMCGSQKSFLLTPSAVRCLWSDTLFRKKTHLRLDSCRGEKTIVSLVNAAMRSEFWSRSVIFIRWDDSRGLRSRTAIE